MVICLLLCRCRYSFPSTNVAASLLPFGKVSALADTMISKSRFASSTSSSVFCCSARATDPLFSSVSPSGLDFPLKPPPRNYYYYNFFRIVVSYLQISRKIFWWSHDRLSYQRGAQLCQVDEFSTLKEKSTMLPGMMSTSA